MSTDPNSPELTMEQVAAEAAQHRSAGASMPGAFTPQSRELPKYVTDRLGAVRERIAGQRRWGKILPAVPGSPALWVVIRELDDEDERRAATIGIEDMSSPRDQIRYGQNSDLMCLVSVTQCDPQGIPDPKSERVAGPDVWATGSLKDFIPSRKQRSFYKDLLTQVQDKTKKEKEDFLSILPEPL